MSGRICNDGVSSASNLAPSPSSTFVCLFCPLRIPPPAHGREEEGERARRTRTRRAQAEWRKVICKTAAAVLGWGLLRRTKRSKRIRNALAPHREERYFGCFLSTYGNVGDNRFPLSLSTLQVKRQITRIQSWENPRNPSIDAVERAKDSCSDRF